MLRDPSLVPLSQQHQHALALCVRIERGLRAADADLARWQAEIVRLFDNEIHCHFAAEEQVLFPAAAALDNLRDLVAELLREHTDLRHAIDNARAGTMAAAELLRFASTLSGHIRKEERRLFEEMQAALAPVELARVGAALNEHFRASGMPPESCGL